MSEESKDLITLDRRGDLSPRVAFLFSMMARMRSRLLRVVEDLTNEEIDYSPDMERIETIGTLLLHIAAVEWSWIFEDIDGTEMDYEKWKHAFALREEKVSQLTKKGLKFYLDRLLEVRSEVFVRLRNLDDSNLHTLIDVGPAEVSIEWILFHILEHEAMHIGQISILKRLAKTSEN